MNRKERERLEANLKGVETNKTMAEEKTAVAWCDAAGTNGRRRGDTESLNQSTRCGTGPRGGPKTETPFGSHDNFYIQNI